MAPKSKYFDVERGIEVFLASMATGAREKVAIVGPSAEELREFFDEIYEETDTTVIIKIHSLFDETFLSSMKHHMGGLNKEELRSLFGPVGPLGNSSSRGLVALALGWIRRDIYDDLNLLRRLRNKFAHSTKSLSIIQEYTEEQHFRSIKKINFDNIVEDSISMDLKSKYGLVLDGRKEFFSHCYMLYVMILYSLTINPIAKEFKVKSGDISGSNLEHMPEGFRRQIREIFRATALVLIGKRYIHGV